MFFNNKSINLLETNVLKQNYSIFSFFLFYTEVYHRSEQSFFEYTSLKLLVDNDTLCLE